MAGLTPTALYLFRRSLRARGLTMADLAAQIGRGRSHLSQVIQGRRPGGYTWARIRAAVKPAEWDLLLRLEHCAAWNSEHPEAAEQGREAA